MVKKHEWLDGLDIDLDLDELSELEGYFSDTDPTIVDETQIPREDVVQQNLRTIVAVDNIPKVDQVKLPKVFNMMTKLFEKFGKIEEKVDVIDPSFATPTSTGIYIPFDPATNLTAGFAFIHYVSPESAEKAAKEMNDFVLDKSHTFKVDTLADLKRYESWPEEPPTADESKEIELSKDQEAELELESWMLDPRGRDQYVLRHAQETEVKYSQGLLGLGAENAQTIGISGLDILNQEEDEVVYDGEREKKEGMVMTEQEIGWSPYGNYLTSFHNQGVAIWGGTDFQKLFRLRHPNVRSAIYNSAETRLLTFDGNSIILWDVRSGKEMRTFKHVNVPIPAVVMAQEAEAISKVLGRGGLAEFANGPSRGEYPMRFSAKGKLFARKIKDGLAVYGAFDAKQAGKSILAKGIVDFAWSPVHDHILAYWAPEEGDQPAAVVLYDVVGRQIVKRKKLFHVKWIKLHWQDLGLFFCAEVLRTTKSGKTTFTNFEIFKTDNTKGVIPNQTVELKQHIVDFAFERGPDATHFGILHREKEGKISTDMRFYTIQKTNLAKIDLVLSQEQVGSKITWSPKGNYLTIDSFAADKPELEAFDLKKKQSLNKIQHHKAKFVTWAPSGLLFASVGNQDMWGENSHADTLENGYFMWSFQGVSLKKVSCHDLYQFLWRPRREEKTILSKQDLEEVEEKLDTLMEEYEKADSLRLKRTRLANDVAKLEMLREFRAVQATLAVIAAEIEEQKKELTQFDDDSDFDVVEEVVEELISEKEEVIQ